MMLSPWSSFHRNGRAVWHQFQRRLFSTQPPSLKRLIQPFVLKCHPDMARQQGLPDSARKVNLQAIQNLNSYVDGIHKLVKSDDSITNSSVYPFPNEKHTVEIEFVIPLTQNSAETSKNNQQFVVSTSRRKLELLVPPMDMPPQRVQKYATRQFLKLLRISDLPVPAALSLLDDDDDDDDEHEQTNPFQQSQQQSSHRRRRPLSAWEASRQRFWRRHNKALDHQKFHKLYKEALQDAQIHVRTRNWIRDNPKLRHQLLSKILSNVQFVQSISPLERLVAYRRLLRFLDQHFDELQLEDAGKYWEEQAKLLVGEPWPYSTNLRKLRTKKNRRKQQQHLETGYSFVVHHDNTVTVGIPIDFDNQELLQELLRNMQDFLQTQGTGLEGDYYSAMYGAQEENSIL